MKSGYSQTPKTWQCQNMAAGDISKAQISIKTIQNYVCTYVCMHVCFY